MKLALYCEDWTTQVVITPETKWEEKTLASIPTDGEAKMLRGNFYDCQGGWIRQGTGLGSGDNPSKSLIFRIDKATEEEVQVKQKSPHVCVWPDCPPANLVKE